jgi:endonuclease III
MENDSPYFPNVDEITSELVRAFGFPSLGNRTDPFEELLYIVLSSRTPPRNYTNTFESLKQRYPKYDVLAEASIDDVAKVIESGGLQQKKASYIVEFSAKIKDIFGSVTLEPLRKMSRDEIEKFLTSLPGISLKTARCVMVYSLDIPVFPVDVHCFRVSKRLGWLNNGEKLINRNANKLQESIPEKYRKYLHVGMIVLSRTYCTPKSPKCTSCPIVQYCPTGKGKVDR